VLTQWNAIFFQLVYHSNIYRSVFLFLYIKLQLELYPSPQPPLSMRMKLFTCSKLGKNHYLTELPGITYIYLYRRIYASCLS